MLIVVDAASTSLTSQRKTSTLSSDQRAAGKLHGSGRTAADGSQV